MVLLAIASLADPLGVDLVVGSCVMELDESDCVEWTTGVPLWVGPGRPLLVDSHLVRGGRSVFSFAETDSVDLPRSGPSFAQMELGASIYHCCGAVLLVLVHMVLETLLHFVNVHVRTESKYMEVPRCDDSRQEFNEW